MMVEGFHALLDRIGNMDIWLKGAKTEAPIYKEMDIRGYEAGDVVYSMSPYQSITTFEH